MNDGTINQLQEPYLTLANQIGEAHGAALAVMVEVKLLNAVVQALINAASPEVRENAAKNLESSAHELQAYAERTRPEGDPVAVAFAQRIPDVLAALRSSATPSG